MGSGWEGEILPTWPAGCISEVSRPVRSTGLTKVQGGWTSGHPLHDPLALAVRDPRGWKDVGRMSHTAPGCEEKQPGGPEPDSGGCREEGSRWERRSQQRGQQWGQDGQPRPRPRARIPKAHSGSRLCDGAPPVLGREPSPRPTSDGCRSRLSLPLPATTVGWLPHGLSWGAEVTHQSALSWHARSMAHLTLTFREQASCVLEKDEAEA